MQISQIFIQAHNLSQMFKKNFQIQYFTLIIWTFIRVFSSDGHYLTNRPVALEG